MTNLVKFNVVMNSKEIAELVESRHDKVKQSIERLAERMVIVQPPMGDVQFFDALGRTRNEKVYTFSGEQGKRDSIIVVAQLSPEFTARLVDRWQELEKMNSYQLPDFTNPAESARAWADEVEAKQIALKRLEEVAPKAEALDRISYAEGAMNITLAAKTLQVQPKKLFDYLASKKWIYRRAGGKSWLGYQDKIQQMLISHKVTVIQVNGEERIQEQVLVTPKGLSKLSVEINTLI